MLLLTPLCFLFGWYGLSLFCFNYFEFDLMEYSSHLHFIFHGNSCQNPDVIQGAKNMRPLFAPFDSSCSPHHEAQRQVHICCEFGDLLFV